MTDIHVFPLNDLLPHDTENGTNCICQPRRDPECPDVINHNALDGRDLRELAKEFEEVARP